MKQDFNTMLRRGRFMIPTCVSCSEIAWPPSANCPRCLSPTQLKKSVTAGTLLEFTRSHVTGKEGVFGLVRMGDIRILGSFDNQPLAEGMTVKMTECGLLDDGTAYYRFVSTPT
jgi:uncharacterized OB-fold protein